MTRLNFSEINKFITGIGLLLVVVGLYSCQNSDKEKVIYTPANTILYETNKRDTLRYEIYDSLLYASVLNFKKNIEKNLSSFKFDSIIPIENIHFNHVIDTLLYLNDSESTRLAMYKASYDNRYLLYHLISNDDKVLHNLIPHFDDVKNKVLGQSQESLFISIDLFAELLNLEILLNNTGELIYFEYFTNID